MPITPPTFFAAPTDDTFEMSFNLLFEEEPEPKRNAPIQSKQNPQRNTSAARNIPSRYNNAQLNDLGLGRSVAYSETSLMPQYFSSNKGPDAILALQRSQPTTDHFPLNNTEHLPTNNTGSESKENLSDSDNSDTEIQNSSKKFTRAKSKNIIIPVSNKSSSQPLLLTHFQTRNNYLNRNRSEPSTSVLVVPRGPANSFI